MPIWSKGLLYCEWDLKGDINTIANDIKQNISVEKSEIGYSCSRCDILYNRY